MIKKLMIAVKPNAVINTVFEHLGDKVYFIMNYICITSHLENNYASTIKDIISLPCCNNSVVQFERTF